MNNKKGFSLIELVTIIVIIGLILIVMVPAVTKLLKNNNTKQYEKYYEIVRAGALRYSDQAKDDLGGYSDNGCVEVSLEDLIKEGYIKKFNDEKTTCTGTSRLINEKGKVSVFVDLSCKNNKGKTTYTLDQINDGACLSSYKVTITTVSNNTSYGTVSPESIELTRGEEAKFTITPATNYQYSHNDCGGTVSGNILTIPNVTESKTCTVTFVDNFAPETPIITRKDYNTFTFTATDNTGVTGYYITKDSTTVPSVTASGWTTSTSYDINGAGTYRVWAKDEDGNVSDTAGTITAYTISRSQGAGSTLTTRYDSTSSSTGTAFTSNTAMLAGTSVWAKATANSGYSNPTLKRGSTTMTASGASFTVSASETITSSATAITYRISVYPQSAGTVSPSSATVASGGTVRITLYPDSGYAFSRLECTNNPTYSVSGNILTFSNVTADHTCSLYYTYVGDSGGGDSGGGDSGGGSSGVCYDGLGPYIWEKYSSCPSGTPLYNCTYSGLVYSSGQSDCPNYGVDGDSFYSFCGTDASGC